MIFKNSDLSDEIQTLNHFWDPHLETTIRSWKNSKEDQPYLQILGSLWRDSDLKQPLKPSSYLETIIGSWRSRKNLKESQLDLQKLGSLWRASDLEPSFIPSSHHRSPIERWKRWRNLNRNSENTDLPNEISALNDLQDLKLSLTHEIILRLSSYL